MKGIHYLSNHSLVSNDSAVLDLPLYLVVTIIIGIIALTGILSMMVIPPYFSPTPELSINPVVTTINRSNTLVHYQALIQTPEGQPIEQAHVIIKNGQTIATNTTNELGKANLTLQVTIPNGLHETYFDVIIKSSNHRISFPQLLKVVLRR